MKIFAIDTSAKSASVALTEDGVIKGEFFINTMLTHSETLMPMTDALLKSTRIELSDIDCFAVNTGPGSFTGLRIGIAAIKGMAYALKKPCAAVSTLESMAYNLHSENTVLCAVMDARCNQVYNALFDISGEAPQRFCEDRALTIDELSKELETIGKKVVLVGDGAQLCYKKMSGINCDLHIADENVRFQRASSTAIAAEKLFADGKTISSEELMPQYLRLPQAQRELIAKKSLNNK